MIWLTWRQHRKQALYTLIALAVLAAVMLPTGLAMHHTYTNSGLAACLAKLPTATITSGNAARLRCLEPTVPEPIPLGVVHRDPVRDPAGHRRNVLRRPADRPRGRSRHPPPRLDPGRQPPTLGAGEIRSGRRRHPDPCRRVHARNGLVGRAPGGQRRADGPDRLRHPGHRPDRLHPLRRRPWHPRQHHVEESPARDGRHPRRLRRRPHPDRNPRPAPLPQPTDRKHPDRPAPSSSTPTPKTGS